MDILSIKSWDDLWILLKDVALSAGLKIIEAALVLIIGLKLCKWFIKRVSKAKFYIKLDKGIQTFITSALKIVLYAFVIIIVVTILGVPQSSFVSLLTSAGVAIGLALQGSLSNFAGGILILIFKPFRVGDYIEAQTVQGTVQDINVIYTVITTFDNKKITLPNGALTNSNIINYSAMTTRRVDLTFSVSYDSDIDFVKELILKNVKDNPLVLEDPAPFVGLKAQGDSALQFIMQAWCNKEDYGTVLFGLNENIKKEFDKNNVQIPYPQMDVHIKEK